MKHHKITIIREISDEDLISILDGIYSACEWFDSVIYLPELYEEAVETLINTGKKKDKILYVEVLLQMLKNGHSIVFRNDEKDKGHILTFDIFLKSIEKHMSSKNCSFMDIGCWDYEDFDNVMQLALFGELLH